MSNEREREREKKNEALRRERKKTNKRVKRENEQSSGLLLPSPHKNREKKQVVRSGVKRVEKRSRQHNVYLSIYTYNRA